MITLMMGQREGRDVSNTLTPRQTEILRWAAEGKSSPEIAAILVERALPG